MKKNPSNPVHKAASFTREPKRLALSRETVLLLTQVRAGFGSPAVIQSSSDPPTCAENACIPTAQ